MTTTDHTPAAAAAGADREGRLDPAERLRLERAFSIPRARFLAGIPLALLVLAWAWRSRTPWREIGYVRPRSWIGSLAAGLVLGGAFKLLMKAAVMPENAAGTTTFNAVCIRVAPSAYEPSRSPRGTARIASSESDDTSGRIINPITSPGLNALKPESVGKKVCSSGVTNVRAK